MDLIDEKQGAAPGRAPAPRLLENLLEIIDAGKYRGNLDKGEIGLMREQARDRRLAGAGRPPENQAAKRAGGDPPGQGAVWSDQMILPDHLGEALRAQPVGERMRRELFETGGGEEISHVGSNLGRAGRKVQRAGDADGRLDRFSRRSPW